MARFFSAFIVGLLLFSAQLASAQVVIQPGQSITVGGSQVSCAVNGVAGAQVVNRCSAMTCVFTGRFTHDCFGCQWQKRELIGPDRMALVNDLRSLCIQPDSLRCDSI